jgi:S-adenosylmethionine synthetase
MFNGIFTSESVAAGHPDKICDQISDALVDAVFERTADPRQARAAIEVLATTQHLTIAGEISKATTLPPDEIEAIARSVVRDLGYTDPAIHFHADQLTVDVRVHAQSEEIAAGVDDGGAGDQGLMFGYARRDNEALMPMPIWAAHRLIERIDRLRESGAMPALRPDGKCQVSVRYENGRPVALDHQKPEPSSGLKCLVERSQSAASARPKSGTEPTAAGGYSHNRRGTSRPVTRSRGH